jgi:putative CocE/NonD family hydrolase
MSYVRLAVILPWILLSPSRGLHAQAQAPFVSTRPAEHAVTVERDVMMPLRDGVKVAADIYHPADGGRPLEGRFPALLTRTPYSKGDGNSAEGLYYAARGYVVVANDTRGRYKSEGTWRMMADDPADGYDVVEWIAAQPWSDGKIGTYGTSYPGGTQHALATMNPPHLTTMVPVDALSNTGIAGMRHGGAFELRFANWIFQTGAPNSHAALASEPLRNALVESGRRIRDHLDMLPFNSGTTPLRLVPEYESWLAKALRSGPEDPMWRIKGMSVVDHVTDYADVPVLHVCGWYDSWGRQVSLSYEALSKSKRSPQHLIYGPWTHGGQTSNVAGEVEFSPDAAVNLLALRVGWYDRWMRDQSPPDTDSPVWVYVMGTGDDRKTDAGHLRHGGSWRPEREWPLARAVPTPFYLHTGGHLRHQPPTGTDGKTTYTFDPSHPVPTIGGNISSNTGLMTSGGYDQRPRDDTHGATNRLPLSERPDVVVFRSDPLDSHLEVTGTVEVKLWVSSTAPDTDFTAKLIDEIPPNPDYPLGFDLNLGDSILRTRYREGLRAQKLMTPGEVVPITITLYPTSNVFKRGHRIRVDVSSSNYPRFDVNPNTGEPLGTSRRKRPADNTVHHDAGHPSQIVLPIVP